MPKETFFNLPEAKRLLIIQTSVAEFAGNTYNKASLSQIVLKAGISKGSMYQYFKDKKELYTYLIDYVSDKKLEYISTALKAGEDDFFLLYKQVILAATRFDLNYPLFSSFLYNVGRDSDHPQIAKRMMAASVLFIEQMLTKASLQGQIRRDINIELTAFMISYLSVDLGEYIGEKFGFSYFSILTSESGEIPVSDDQIEEVLNEVIDFFKKGIAMKN